MAVRFVIGRAGTGKTALCIREIHAELARDALGAPLLWIVPEQSTFSAERLLLTAPGARRGTFRAQVLGFRRLALAIARETGLLAGPAGALAKPMDDIARTVLLEEIVRHERENLTVFRAAAGRPGFIAHLDAMLRELRQHGHSGMSLRALAEQRLEPVMTRKLLDLAVLLDAWSIELEKSGAWDFEHLMHAAALKAGESALIAGPAPARVWVDAFSEMCALEVRMLAALGKHARDVTITLLADPDSPSLRAQRRNDTESGLFTRPERLHRRLVDEFRRQQVALAGTVALRETHRFANPVLAHVEAQLFAERPKPFMPPNGAPPMQAAPASAPYLPERIEPPHSRGKRRASDQPGLFDAMPCASETLRCSVPKIQDASPSIPGSDSSGHTLELWEAADPECEVRAVARAIRGLALGKTGAAPLRCRQIAVIVPDLEGYHDAIRRAFSAHGIPHFIDLRRGIAHHPLVELLRSAVAIAAARWDRDDLMLYLKSGLAGVPRENVPALENYLIEHGITRVAWDRDWPWLAANQRDDEADADIPAAARQRLAAVNALRQRVWNDLQPFVEQCLASAPEAAHYVRALQDLLTRLGTEKTLEAWAAAARRAGDPEMAQVHKQAGREATRILKLLETLLTGRTRTLVEFQRLLEAALAQLTLGLIPPTVDQVLVSSVARSRVPEMEAVFILGAVEGRMPQVPDEDPILSDEQRAIFNAHASDPIGEGSSRGLLEASFLDYVALTRSRRVLVITRPLTDAQGKALAPCRHLVRLETLLGPALLRHSVSAGPGDPDHIGTTDDLLAHVTSWARQTIASGDAGTGITPALYNRLLATQDDALATARQIAWRAVVPQRQPALSPDLAARLYPPAVPIRLSVSQLERFAACPLQYFFEYTLKLRPREELELDGRGLGSLLHDILERIYRRIIAGEIDWPTDPVALRAAIAAEVDAAAADMHPELADHLPGYDKTRARLKRTLGIILEADRRRSDQGYLRPEAVEFFFGGTGIRRDRSGKILSLPALVVPAGMHVAHVGGKIDRIDVTQGDDALAVIDYKSGAGKSIDLACVRAGLSLQLPVYALVTLPLDKPAIAALYLNLGVKLSRVTSAADAPRPDSDEFYKAFKPRGLIDALHAHWLDNALQADPDGATGKGISSWYNARFNQDGGIGKLSDLLPREDFNLVLAHVRATIARLAAQLAGGRIAPEPCRHHRATPCQHCAFTALCSFDRAAGMYRDIPSDKGPKALEKMRHDFLHPTAHPVQSTST